MYIFVVAVNIGGGHFIFDPINNVCWHDPGLVEASSACRLLLQGHWQRIYCRNFPKLQKRFLEQRKITKVFNFRVIRKPSTQIMENGQYKKELQCRMFKVSFNDSCTLFDISFKSELWSFGEFSSKQFIGSD